MRQSWGQVGYANTSLSTLAAVRKAGQKAGWYTSGVPSGHGSLNCKQHTKRFEAPISIQDNASLSVACVQATWPWPQRCPCATTGYVEYPAVRSRLLMGTAAWKHKVDMYLYYELGSWSPFFSVGGYRP